jgi:hypothetical protein
VPSAESVVQADAIEGHSSGWDRWQVPLWPTVDMMDREVPTNHIFLTDDHEDGEASETEPEAEKEESILNQDFFLQVRDLVRS